MKARILIGLFVLFSLCSAAQSWKELSDSLIFYYSKKDYQKALPWAERATIATKEKFGAESNVYASYLSMLAGLYVNTQNNSKAISPLQQALELYRKNVGEDHKDFIQTMNALAVTYSSIGQDNMSAPLLLQLTFICRKKYGEESGRICSQFE
jgi:tetratricopeptide (TPR) repeat protein